MGALTSQDPQRLMQKKPQHWKQKTCLVKFCVIVLIVLCSSLQVYESFWDVLMF